MTKINVKVVYQYEYTPQITVFEDGFISFCNHAITSMEHIPHPSLPDDTVVAEVCEKCDIEIREDNWL